MANKIVDDVELEMRSLMDDTVGAMADMQPEPPGMRSRTPQEKAQLFDRLLALGPEGFGGVMEVLAERAGHEEGEESPCEVCSFIADQVIERVKKGK